MSGLSLLLTVVFLTLAFEFSNGWHDAANSIATVVSTRPQPLTAVAWAAFWNFIAAFFFGTAVAGTIGKGLVQIELINQQVILAGLLGAITWNLTTHHLGPRVAHKFLARAHGWLRRRGCRLRRA
jgi:PiT family inorganic phosphate transporter